MITPPEKLTATPGVAPSVVPQDLLSGMLAQVRLAGAIFLRAELTAPWALRSPPPDQLIRLLGQEARRLILFHIVAQGRFLVRSRGGALVEAGAGDVVVIPYGEQHVMSSAEDVEPIPIESILSAPPWDRLPAIEHGGGGRRLEMVCGYLHSDDPIFDPVVRALPSVFVVRPPGGPAAVWITASIQYALDASEGRRTSPSGLGVRLPELVFTHVLRLYLEGDSPPSGGPLRALHDPVVGPALVELHADPAHKWTVDELARRTASSRSVLTERFGRLLGRPPMQYLADWRLQLGAGLLRDTLLGVAAIANQVGYESEEAFNRAFKRAMGTPPARWRRRVTAG